MTRVETFKNWRIRITAVNEHRWEYEENGEWKIYPSGPPIRLDQDSTGYIFYDEQWLNHAGTGPTVPNLSITALDQGSPNPFGAGAHPSFSPASTDATHGVQAFRWNIVGSDSRFPAGFPQTTEKQVWSFSVLSGDVKVDPEMVILRPDPPPKG